MDSVELKISLKDWIYITTLGSLFGVLLGVFFYYIDSRFQVTSTVYFGFFVGLSIALCAAFFITISNNYILPNIEKKFWYLISFGFSFYSGSFGFLFVYTVYDLFNIPLADIIATYSIYLTLIVGFITFLIGLILHKFISMKYKNESIKTQVLDARIKALENELNPHFLFNALNSMSELVHIDQNKAEESIINLSKFLRNAISKDSIVSIDTELGMVNTYVNIENIRFSNKIKLQITNHLQTIELIPKFSIQLLVENAIKHGYNHDELHIDIIIDQSKITVSNNGKLPNKNIIEGTGLTNLKERLFYFNIGTLGYDIVKDKINFYIKFNKDKR